MLLRAWPEGLSWSRYATGQSISQADRRVLEDILWLVESRGTIGQSGGTHLGLIVQTLTQTDPSGVFTDDVPLLRRNLVGHLSLMEAVRFEDDSYAMTNLRTESNSLWFYAIGREFHVQGDLDRATLYLLAAKDLGYEPAQRQLQRVYEDRIEQARNHAANGDTSRARVELERVIETGSDPFTTGLARLEWARLIDDLALAEQTWLEVERTASDSLLQRLAIEDLLKLYLEQGRYCEAGALAERGIGLLPDSGTFYFYLGRSYEGLGAWQQASRAYLQAVDRFPNYEPYERRLRHSEQQARTNPALDPASICVQDQLRPEDH
jgi:tetratricopeptide (TPR) repeat protein